MTSLLTRLGRRIGIVKLRQVADDLRHRLSFVPGLYVVAGIVVSQALLFVDRRLGETDLPDLLSTTVASARSLFTAIAGGLITAITLLLSMMLVTVQLASSQYSPRTLRDWLGDRTLQHTVGIALGTTVFCLLALRSARSFGEGNGEVVPHTTVILAVLLGVVSLFAVVRSVDHITHSLRIGVVAKRIAHETISVIRNRDEVHAGQAAVRVPAPTAVPDASDDSWVEQIPEDAWALEAPVSGWVQQIDVDTIVRALPSGSTGHVAVALGGYVPSDTPLLWVWPTPADDDVHRLLAGFALGDTRTMQQDVAFGEMQLTDIAVRALSPGINDPSTANDIVVHLGDVLLELWSRPAGSHTVEHEGRLLISRRAHHAEHLSRSFDPIRRYGCADPLVMSTMLRTLHLLRRERARRSLPGPLEPIDHMIRCVGDSLDTRRWSAAEIADVRSLVESHRADV